MRHPDRAAARAIPGALAAILLLVLGGSANADPMSGTASPSILPEPPSSADQAAPKPALDDTDETATLQAVHIGLTEIPDGANFVWRRAHGRLSGVVRPLFSFKDVNGNVCRHIVLTLKSGTYVRTVEGIACREPDGRWALDG